MSHKPRDPQPDVPGLPGPRPRVIVVNGRELDATLADLQNQGAILEALETGPGCNGQWRLQVRWAAHGRCQLPPLPAKAGWWRLSF